MTMSHGTCRRCGLATLGALMLTPTAAASVHEPIPFAKATQMATQHERAAAHIIYGSRRARVVLGGIAVVSGCHRSPDRHQVRCAVSWSRLYRGVRYVYDWTDVVTRSGPCALPVTRRTGPDSGISSGTVAGSDFHNCFNGPLVVFSVAGGRR